MTPPLRIFIGFDQREAIAYHVLSHSILSRASAPVSITPLVRKSLGEVYTRPRGCMESTDFSLTRFLVPYLSGYEGVSIFMDCDMLCLTDIWGLFPWHPSHDREPKAVHVVKHDYTPKTATKMGGLPQTAYPRKNWSSLMVFDNARCGALSPGYIHKATALQLHRFEWILDEQIGSLPLEWNWLVGEYEDIFIPPDRPKILHYTLGGPWFPAYRSCHYSATWIQEAEAAGVRLVP